jgi:ATP-binding cassette subfamily C exporter for protease/lipase
MKPGNKTNALLGEALKNQTTPFRKVIFFSFFINLLVMAPTVYMLEVYDRVVNSRSIATLVMLTGLIVFAYIILESLEWIRTRMLTEIANDFDAKIRSTVFKTVFEANLRRLPSGNHQALQDLKTVREFISSPATMAVIDVPLAMLYIIAIFFD